MPGRWEPEITAFERLDATRPPDPNRVVFYGSSTIRLWSTLPYDFPELKVSNRGFGGASMRDVADNVSRAIGQPAPRHLIMYAGGNDLAALQKVEEIIVHLNSFVESALALDPHVQLSLISVIPHRRFWPLIHQIKRYNELTHGLSESDPRLTYVDVATPMLELGAPPPNELFINDEIHLSQKGYNILVQVCRKSLQL